MRIDQPDPIDSGDPAEPGASRETEAASERMPRREIEAAPEQTPRRETEVAPERTPRRETEAPEQSPRREAEAPERTPRPETEAVPEVILRQEAKPPASRADQIAAHLSYRETVSVTVRAADGRAAWAEAVPALRAAWEEHKGRYPEQTRVTPRSGPDGSWTCGEHHRLDPEQNTEATKAHADLADEADRDILPALRRVEAEDPDRQLAGLEHMVKGEDRLKEKLADVMLVETRLTTRQALDKIPDAVRFTLTYSAECYTESVLVDVDRLKAEGFELIKLRNVWHSDQYKGINSQWRRPETGTRVEMQFHTPESLDAKELTHEAYERLRRPETETSRSERDKLEEFQRQVNTLIATPPYAETIKDFPEKKR
jgi:hypothetical protein